MKQGFSVLGLVLVAAFGLVACGSDDDDDSSSTGNGSAAVTSCNSYCDKDAAAMCGLYTTAAECKDTECSDLGGAPAACADKIKAYYDCQGAQSDVCAIGCDAEFNAMVDACM